MSVVSLGRQYRHAYNAELRAHADADAARHQLEREHAELERITASRAALVRGFTHDVKNPIGAAAGDLQLLQMEAAGPLSEKQRASLNRASRALGASLALIEDLLTLARAETMEMARAEIDVRSLLREVVDEHRAAASAKSLELTVDTSAHTPSIETDPARVRQILGNLLSNAVKYTSRGTVAVRVRRQGRERRYWIAIDVADTGPGIPEAQMAELFKEFHRLGSSHGTNGSGIGLAISQRLARALDGDISVESTEGRGSVFTLWLPLYPSRAAS
jgi:signal transduction histidine kinase